MKVAKIRGYLRPENPTLYERAFSMEYFYPSFVKTDSVYVVWLIPYRNIHES